MVAGYNSQQRGGTGATTIGAGTAAASFGGGQSSVSECVHVLCAELSRNEEEDGVGPPLNSVFKQRRVQTLLELYSTVSRHYASKFKPFRENAARVLREVELELSSGSGSAVPVGAAQVENPPSNAAVRELLERLSSPNLRAVIAAHDTIADHDFEPSLMDVPYEVDEDDGAAVRIVRLVKRNEPLGATIKKVEKNSALVIARVIRGGVADRSGCIGIGDQVIEVNGVSVVGKEPIEVVKLINSGESSVLLKLIPANRDSVVAAAAAAARSPEDTGSVLMLHLRALFDYSPQEDGLNPCPEASLQFRCGDVLRVVDANDEKWWQARFEIGNATNKVGLIPSWQLQNRKQLSKRSPVRGSGSPLPRSISSLRKHRETKCDSRSVDECELDDVRSYEEVALLSPSAELCRPVVLIGPPGIGRNELKRRLILFDAKRFSTTIPTTSRPPKPGETEGVEYYFKSRQEMEKMIRERRFIEYGEYKGSLYGTTIDSVKNVMAQRRTCILNPHPQAVRALRTPELKPYFIFVKPPPYPTLEATRNCAEVRSTFDSDYNRGFTSAELLQMIETGSRLEATLGHLFDYVLINGSLDFAFRELVETISSMQTKPCWVPKEWVSS